MPARSTASTVIHLEEIELVSLPQAYARLTRSMLGEVDIYRNVREARSLDALEYQLSTSFSFRSCFAACDANLRRNFAHFA